MKKSKTTNGAALTVPAVKEVVDQMLRSAFQEHSRQMEEHLRDIDSRIKKLEKRRQMKLSNQAMGALMMALQKSLLEQTDIVPLLEEMNFQVDPEDQSHSALVITNPPVVSLENTVLDELVESLED